MKFEYCNFVNIYADKVFFFIQLFTFYLIDVIITNINIYS